MLEKRAALKGATAQKTERTGEEREEEKAKLPEELDVVLPQPRDVPRGVNTTPQMTCFRGAKECTKWLQGKVMMN